MSDFTPARGGGMKRAISIIAVLWTLLALAIGPVTVPLAFSLIRGAL